MHDALLVFTVYATVYSTKVHERPGAFHYSGKHTKRQKKRPHIDSSHGLTREAGGRAGAGVRATGSIRAIQSVPPRMQGHTMSWLRGRMTDEHRRDRSEKDPVCV